MGLYGQRVGCLSVVTASPEQAKAVESQIKARASLPLSRHSSMSHMSLGMLHMFNMFRKCMLYILIWGALAL